MSHSPTSRTLALLREWDWIAGVVERRQGPKTVDLFGWIDILALDTENGLTVGIQVTSGSNHSTRKCKVLRLARDWLLCTGNRAEVWSWRKYAEPVEGKLWRPRIDAVTLADVGGPPPFDVGRPL